MQEQSSSRCCVCLAFGHTHERVCGDSGSNARTWTIVKAINKMQYLHSGERAAAAKAEAEGEGERRVREKLILA